MSGNDILQNHLEAVKENSKTVRNIYLSYLVFATYIWLTAESVTHLQLLIPKEGLSLPIIGVKLSVVGFFWVAPILLFLFHIYFALHVWKLSELLQKVRMDMPGVTAGWQDQIPGSMFLWWFIKSPSQPWLISKIINSFVFLSFWCVVPIVLLRCQWQFLPYHHSIINLLFQSLLTISLIFTYFFISKIDPSEIQIPSLGEIRAKIMYPLKIRALIIRTLWSLIIFIKNRWFLIFIGVFIVLFSWTVLIIPGNKEENGACFEGIQKPFEWIALALKNKAPKSECKNGEGLKIKDVINRNLILPEKQLAIKPSDTLIAAYKDKPEEILEKYGTLDLKERHLEFADFYKADLRKADLRYSFLKGADLSDAYLQGAVISDAYLQIANLSFAEIQGANFENTWFQGADLSFAEIQGANLWRAQLQGANLSNAYLQGAVLSESGLQGANLSNAELQGAYLSYAYLQGADLSFSKLQGADLSDAYLQGADLGYAELQGANFENSRLVVLNILKKELNTIIKIVQLEGEASKSLEINLRKRQGKRTNIEVSRNLKFLHSYPNFNVETKIKYLEKSDTFPGIPFVYFNKAKNQIQFKDIPSQTLDENLTMRKKIYGPLLCKYPILIKRNLEENWAGILSQEEAIDYALKQCPQHLPEKYRKSKKPPTAKN